MSIAAAIITGIVGVTTTLIGGKLQGDALKSGQDEARSMHYEGIAQRNRELASQEKLTRDQMRQNQRQFGESLEFNREQFGETKNVNARTAFRNQYASLTGILDKNENLKNIFTNRMKSLRG